MTADLDGPPRAVRSHLLARLRLGGPRAPIPLVGWIGIVIVTLVVFWASVPGFVAFYGLPIAAAFGLATLQSASVPLAVRLPKTALAGHIGSLVLVALVTSSSTDEFWPVSVPSLLALTSVLVVVSWRERWVVAVSGWWFSFLCLSLTVAAVAGPHRSTSDWGIDLLVTVTITLIAVVVSVGIGQRRRVQAALASAARDVELEQAKRSAVEDRARIARELHDVVAHSMSIVHIQAESARYRVSDLDQSRREFEEIARSARDALREMRQILGALRPEGDAVEYGPQPTAADIPSLIGGLRRIGHDVTLQMDVRPGTMSTLTELTIYRIVQEALSNIVRHAPGATASVVVTTSTRNLRVAVVNGRPPRAASPPIFGVGPVDHGGNGLRGMRERVELLGGTIKNGPSPDGGYAIEALLPLTIPASQESP